MEIKTDLTKPGQTDVLEDSINYVEVYDMVASIMTGESCNLLEHIGALIVRIHSTNIFKELLV